MLTIFALIPVLVFGTIILLVWALAAPSEQTLQNRLRSYGYDLSRRAAGDLTLPFGQRVLLPIGLKIARLITRLTPTGVIATSRLRLHQAKQPMSLGAFLTIRFGLAVVLPGIAVLPALRGQGFGFREIGIGLVLLFIGYKLPGIWLSFRIDGRREQVTRSLPDALDLIVVCVEAGLGLEAAIARVVESTTGPLADEFAQTLTEISLGRGRREALNDMSVRCGSPDLQTFIAAITQADQMGVSIADALRVQADAMRIRRRQRAEETIAKAPVKMLLPLTVFIFPSLFVVILGPAGMRILEMFGSVKH